MKNIPGIKFESSVGGRYTEKMAELTKRLEILKRELKESEKRLALALRRIPNIVKEIQIERKTNATPSGAEADLEMMMGIKRNDGNLSESLKEEIRGIEKSIDELEALEERFRGQPLAKA